MRFVGAVDPTSFALAVMQAFFVPSRWPTNKFLTNSGLCSMCELRAESSDIFFLLCPLPMTMQEGEEVNAPKATGRDDRASRVQGAKQHMKYRDQRIRAK